MLNDWKEYQEKAALFFRGLGMDAQADVTVKGVRTSHDVDVLVKSSHAGFDVTWIVECKQWSSRVTKLHVLALREIVADVGADRGILLAESGFQSGAIEAAALTNVHVTSLVDVQRKTCDDFFALRIRELFDRVSAATEKYWDIPKKVRIAQGLRQEVGAYGYSAGMLLKTTDELLKKAFRGTYPIRIEHDHRLIVPALPEAFDSAESVVRAFEPLIEDLEKKLGGAGPGTIS